MEMEDLAAKRENETEGSRGKERKQIVLESE